MLNILFDPFIRPNRYAVTFARLHSTEMPGHADYAPSVTDVPGSVKQALRGIDGNDGAVNSRW